MYPSVAYGNPGCIMAVKTRNNPLSVLAATALALVLLLPVQPASGVMVNNLYQTTVPVAGENEEHLAEGYKIGLGQVLTKVSGDRSVASNESLTPIFDNVASLVEGRQLQTTDDGEHLLTLQFSRSQVNRALADAGARVWGSNRPLTLAWVAVQEGGDRGLLVETGETSDQGWSALLLDTAQSRGIPLELPPADRAGDRRLLSEVWGQFMSQVARASSGLEHDLLAVVRISRRQGGWQASWVYEGAGVEQARSVTAQTPETLVDEMLDNWASDLAGRYGVSGSNVDTGPRVQLRVDGVNSPSSYATARSALSRLNPVTSVGAVSVAPDHVVFEIEYEGELSQFRQNIALEPRFRPSGGPSSGQVEEDFRNPQQTLFYRWQPAGVIPPGNEGR